MVGFTLYPAIEQKIIIKLETEVKDLQAFQTEAVVQSVTSDGALCLILLEDFAADSIKPGLPVTVEYCRERNFYRLKALIENITSDQDEEIEKQGTILTLTQSSDLKKIDRRKFFRLSISLPIRFISVSIPGDFYKSSPQKKKAMASWSKKLNIQSYTSQTIDLSAGGLSMIAESPLSKGEEILLEILISDFSLRVTGKVIWCISPEDGSAQRVGIRFIGLEENEQDQIISFIFKEERRKKWAQL